MIPKPFGLVESENYTAQLEKLGDVQLFDDALCIVTFALAKNPTIWHVVPIFRHIRLLKTATPLSNIPVFDIWFKILEKEGRIELLWIEKRSP